MSIGHARAFAQVEATVSGVVTDESSAALPGVTVTATEVGSGRQYVSVTNERGEYRLPSLLPGAYRIQAELTGFATVVVPRLELLVGQNATVPLTLKVAALAETLTVTADAPLINTQTVDVGGNIDRRQMEALPIQGRNWMELSLMVKGVTANDVGANRPVARDDLFQLNLDGQQITQQVASANSSGQPRLSREAIAEYQVLSSMYDVTMGRSVGLQVQAISRAGTNRLSGSAYGYFRDDALNAKDFVAKRVLPYANQQTGFSISGPIVRDEVQYFGTYEYERKPGTIVMTLQALLGQTWVQPRTITQHSLLARADYQLRPNDHLMVRGTYSGFANPFSQAIGTDYPNAASDGWRTSTIVTANWARVLSSNAVQDTWQASNRLTVNLGLRWDLIGHEEHRVVERRAVRARRIVCAPLQRSLQPAQHANYGNYNAIVGTPGFGQPVQNANLAYMPRVLQLAFRVAFGSCPGGSEDPPRPGRAGRGVDGAISGGAGPASSVGAGLQTRPGRWPNPSIARCATASAWCAAGTPQ